MGKVSPQEVLGYLGITRSDCILYAMRLEVENVRGRGLGVRELGAMSHACVGMPGGSWPIPTRSASEEPHTSPKR